MLLLSSPRKARQRGALLVLLAAVLLCVVPVSASLPAGRNCPHLDCAREKRKFCPPGSSQCGSCLSSLEENEEGYCVAKKRHHQQGKVTLYPTLDEEIDYLQSIIEKQQVTSNEIKQARERPKNDAALSAQSDANKSKTDAPQHKPNSHGRLSDEGPHATNAAPRPALSALPDTPTSKPIATAVMGRVGHISGRPVGRDKIIIIIISMCVAMGTIAVILATVCYVKLQKESRLTDKIDYPAFGGVDMPAATANSTSMGDKTLAQSAQMYHYQHQKQQMLSMGNHKPEQKSLDTEVTSDEEDVGGDFTVYECPGLAPTGEMEVKNPLFDDSDLNYQGNHK